MALHPNQERVYERILLFGEEGTRKTSNWLDIAKFAEKTGSDAVFHAIDSDFAIPRMMSGEKYGGLSNVRDIQVSNWTELVEASEKIRADIRPHDWLVIDMIGWGWGWVQDEWIARRYGVSGSQHWGQYIERGGKGNALEGDTDWNVINRNWREFTGPLMRLQAHLYCTAAARKVGERDGAEIKKDFARYGFRPDGQKHLSYLFHTVLLSTNTGPAEWRLTTIKDREREYWEGEVVNNFATGYLLKTAKWKP